MSSLKDFYDNAVGHKASTQPLTRFCFNSSAALYGHAGAFGITAGAHRLFAHKSYKANRPMKLMLLFLQTIAFQNSVFEWARDHR
jgi:fatty-acid desaturase